MRIGERLNRVEQAANARLQALLTPKNVLAARGEMGARMLDYIRLPRGDGDGMAWRTAYDERIARRMLAAGVDRRAAQVAVNAEDRGISEDEAREQLEAGSALWRQAARDMLAGVPFEQSPAAARFRELLITAQRFNHA